MNKQEFLRRLESGLAGVAPDERVAAVQYYTEYFDDAGVDNEHNVLEELGDPDTLAADIKAVSELVEEEPGTANEAPVILEAEEITLVNDPIQLGDAPAAPEAPAAAQVVAAPGTPQANPAKVDGVPPQYRFPGGYVPPRYGVQPQGTPYYGQQGQPFAGQQQTPGTPPPAYNGQPYTQRPSSGGGASAVKVILIILLVMLSPALLGVGIALAVSALVIMLIPFIIGAAFLFSAVLIFVVALYLMPASFASGLLLLGLCLLFLAGGLAVCWAGIKLFVKGLPAFVRGTANIIRSIFGHKRRA